MRYGVCKLPSDTAARGAMSGPVGAWRVQFGDELFVYAANRNWDSAARNLSARGGVVTSDKQSVVKGRLHLVVQKGRLFQQEHPGVPVLYDRGRYLVVDISPARAAKLAKQVEPCFSIENLQEDSVVFEVRPPSAARAERLGWVDALVESIQISRWRARVDGLSALPTRHSTSDLYKEAAEASASELRNMGYQVTTLAVDVAGAASLNVVADRVGAGAGARDLVIVGAHLDSVSRPNENAPGADDNASGSAGALEIAGVLGTHSAEHDLRIVLFGGEEQGLHGSTQYVQSLPQTDRARVRFMLNMDMIGCQNAPQAGVLLEGAPVSQSVIDALADAAAAYTSLQVKTSLNPFASDHVPFIQADMPGVLTIEGDDSSNDRIHTGNDTADTIDNDLAADILRMNVAALATALGTIGAAQPAPQGGDGGAAAPAPQAGGGAAHAAATLPWRLSGRYVVNGGAPTRTLALGAGARSTLNEALLSDSMYELETPIYLLGGGDASDVARAGNTERITLRVDIDGADPLAVVSGLVARATQPAGTQPEHFIGRVTTDDPGPGTRDLVVEEFRLDWPGSADIIDRLEIRLTGMPPATPTLRATFVASATGNRKGPFELTQSSPFFRDVEVQVDREDSAAEAEPYATHTHPDRPADLPDETLTLESAFARSGIRITRSAESDVIDTSEAGPNQRWSHQELHDAMRNHWRAFANKPQWKMWIFLAEHHERGGLGGVMFDGDINEPGGVDRQGTALFTQQVGFHKPEGSYPQANPPAAEAARRELFFNLLHETGHAFNLFHSFQKELQTPWDAPDWNPVAHRPQSLSWMNYPDSASPGGGSAAKWFYDRFRFRFDDGENLFLRHAPERFVQMGAAAWGTNHARASADRIDRRLQLLVRGRKQTVDFGETVYVEVRIENVSNETVILHGNGDPSEGFLEVAVMGPDGVRRPFIPPWHVRAQVEQYVLKPQERFYRPLNLTMGTLGFPFKLPGIYRIEVAYRHADGSECSTAMRLRVRAPRDETQHLTVVDLFHAGIGSVLEVGGSRTLDDVNERIDWATGRLATDDPVSVNLRVARNMPLSRTFKVVETAATRAPGKPGRVRMLDAEPDLAAHGLQQVVRNFEESADSLGHINMREVVDTYARCAKDMGDRKSAFNAQRQMLDVFAQRNVVPQALEEIEEEMHRYS